MDRIGLRLHSAIAVEDIDDGVIMHDTRTGLRIEVTAPDATDSVFKDLGFIDDLPINVLRARQRPFREQWQADRRRAMLDDLIGNARLSDLPITTKSDLRDRLGGRSFQSEVNAGRAIWIRTSGSTGPRLLVPSDLTLDRAPPYFEDVWNIPSGSRRIAVLTNPRCASSVLCATEPEERTLWGVTLTLNSTPRPFAPDGRLLRSIHEDLWDFGPRILVVNPVWMILIAQRMREAGFDLPPIDLVLTSYQYCTIRQRAALASLFNAPVYAHYTSSDMCGTVIADQCKYGHWHVREDQCLTEIVDDAGQPTEQIGRILVTTNNHLVPLTRYAIGDLGRHVARDCPCPMCDWQVLEFHGRSDECLWLNGRRLTTRQLDDVVSRVPEALFYQCEQTDEGCILRVIADDRVAREVAEALGDHGMPMPVKTVYELTSLESEKFPVILHRKPMPLAAMQRQPEAA